MKQFTQGLAALVCVAALGYLSLATTNDAKASADDSAVLDATLSAEASTAIATPQDSVAKNCSRCSFIKSNDAKNFCRAKCEGKSSYCSFIKNNDQKNYCRAVVDRKSSYCSFIKNNDLKQQCRAEAG